MAHTEARRGMNAEEILNSDGYFRCERFQCALRKAVCVARQKQGVKQLWVAGKAPMLRPEFLECQNCDQGRQIAKEMEDKMGDLKHPCKDCGEREAVISKKTGRPMHGRCGPCQGEKISDGWRKKLAADGQGARSREQGDKSREQGGLPSRKPIVSREESMLITLDFTGHAELLQYVRDRSEREFRAADQQILWTLFGEFEFTKKCDG